MDYFELAKKLVRDHVADLDQKRRESAGEFEQENQEWVKPKKKGADDEPVRIE